MNDKVQWAVDLPDPRDLGAPWIQVGIFDTKAEAYKLLRLIFGFAKSRGLGPVFVTRIEP